MNEQIWISLRSGLLGSFFGGLITYLVTKYSLQETVKNTLLWEARKKESESAENVKIAYRALIVETEENVESIQRWKDFRANFRFSREAWIVYKSIVPAFDHSIQEKLIKNYALIGRYNTIIDYDVNVPVGHGTLDKQKEDRIAEIELSLNELRTLLRDNISS